MKQFIIEDVDPEIGSGVRTEVTITQEPGPGDEVVDITQWNDFSTTARINRSDDTVLLGLQGALALRDALLDVFPLTHSFSVRPTGL